MSNLNVKDKDIVVPGDVLATGMDYLPANGTFRKGDKIIAFHVGLVNIDKRLIKLIPLSGRYMPKRGDTVIGIVRDITFNGWLIDIGFANLAMVSLRDGTSNFIERGADLSGYYNYEDVVVANVINVSGNMSVDLTMKGPGLMKLKDGKLIKITPSKVPRIIGKQGSMISLVKEATGCRIVVGQNGLCWISGSDVSKEKLASDVVLMIDKESHVSGLTDKIQKFLRKEK